MELIAIQKNIMINPEMIESVEVKNKKFIVTMESGNSYHVETNVSTFMKTLGKSGIDLTKQFLSV